MKTTNNMSVLHRILLVLCGLALVAVIFLPIWRIELDAAQYPEGLDLQIFIHTLSEQVDIINWLNHYSGMTTLHREDFKKFTVRPYISRFFAGAFTVVGLANKRNWVYYLFGASMLLA